MLLAVLFAVTTDGRWTRAVWIVVALGALVVATQRIRQRRRPGEEMLFADDGQFVYARTSTGLQ